jgi:hypothetical protein
MIIFSNFNRLFEGTSVLFAERRGAQIRSDSIRNFGITPTVSSADENYIIFKITPPSDRGVLYQYFQFIHAEAVTVEAEDLNRFVTDKVIRTGMIQNWNAISGFLDKRTPEELFDSLERAALMVFSARPQEIGTEHSADDKFVRQQQETATLEAMKAAGIKDPLEGYTRLDERRAREAAEVRERESSGYEDFAAEQETPTEQQFTHSGFPVGTTESEWD